MKAISRSGTLFSYDWAGRLMHIRYLWLLLAVGGAGFSSRGFLPQRDKKPAPPEPVRSVIAVSMGEFATLGVSGGWQYWNKKGKGGIPHNPDSIRPNGTRDILSVYYPVIGPYDQTDPHAVDLYYQYMKILGIDAESTNVRTLTPWRLKSARLRVAAMQKYGIRGLLRYEDKEHYPPYDTATPDAERHRLVHRELTTWYKLYRPVQYRIDGRPVVMFFTVRSPDSVIVAWRNGLPPAERPLFFCWANGLKAYADGDYEWIGAEPHKDESQPPYQWKVNTWQMIEQNRAWEVARARQRLADGLISYHLDAVSPGFDDTGSWGWQQGPRKVERFSGRTYAYRWEQAIRDGFQRVVIPTWDDWGEGSAILPTLEFGYRELEATRQYVARYKNVAPTVIDLQVPVRIYQIRKSIQDQKTLKAMQYASDCIAAGRFGEAGQVVAEHARRLHLPGQ